MMLPFDLHMHSKYSFDGVMAPRHILQLAKRRGLAGIAVTDHNTIAGGVEAAALNHDPDFLVIVGAEIQTEVGDIVGLFLRREIKSRLSREVVDEIHEQGGVAILPHPYAHHQNLTAELLRELDCVEIYNGRDKADYSQQAYSDFARPYQLTPVANSDAHLYWEIGRAITCANIKRRHVEAVREALLSGQCEPERHAEKRSTVAVYSSKIVKRVKRLL
jgi:predicted metal-dependent phosphoesterase TrpH